MMELMMTNSNKAKEEKERLINRKEKMEKLSIKENLLIKEKERLRMLIMME